MIDKNLKSVQMSKVTPISLQELHKGKAITTEANTTTFTMSKTSTNSETIVGKSGSISISIEKVSKINQ